MNERILVPVDGSEPSLRALDAAADLAQTLGATLIVCHIVDLSRAAMLTFGEPQLVAGCLDALRSEGASIVSSGAERVHAKVGNVETRLAQGSAAQEIPRVARDTAATWIVMGSHGRSGFGRAVMGSVAEGVLRQSPVPVMIVTPRHAAPHR